MNQNLNKLQLELKSITSSAIGRRAFLSSVPVLLAACSTAPKTRMREGDNSGQQAALTPAEERNIADEYEPQMEEE